VITAATAAMKGEDANAIGAHVAEGRQSWGRFASLTRLAPKPLRRRWARIVEWVWLTVAVTHSALFEREIATVCVLANPARFVWVVWLLIGANSACAREKKRTRTKGHSP
jgi:hypothetical protein